tara:strand:+ start:3948 stop:5231 length:1284 start_codon:yes stop_codon:yes gene_type:complete
MKLKNSNNLLKRAENVIPSATQTFSKGPTQWARGVSPAYLVRGDGAWVWDVDENKYLDHLMALGPIILGYNNQYVNKATSEQLGDGSIFSQMHPLEVEVAELLTRIIPCAEMVRFGKTGSDATGAAIRCARAFTERDHIAICGYHGWHDWYIGSTTRNSGVPDSVKELTHTFTYNNIDTLKNIFKKFPGKIAAVMMEPVGIVKPENRFLESVKEVTKDEGAILIFDEIVTGFRMAMGGAQEYYKIKPDLACFGKGMANGMPLSAVVGRKDIMQIFNEVFFSGTFNGDAISLAACKATIQELEKNGGVSLIWKYGNNLLQGIQELINDNGLNKSVKTIGYGFRSIIDFTGEDEAEVLLRRSYFMQECVKRGLLYSCLNLPSLSHKTEELNFTLETLSEVFSLFSLAEQANDFKNRLDGPSIEAIFRKP